MKIRQKLKASMVKMADQLGADYEAARERAVTAGNVQKSLATEIKTIAREHGSWFGDRCAIDGNTYSIGLTAIRAKQVVDWVAFRKKYPKLWWKYLSSRQTDEEKVELALTNGSLSRVLLAKFLVTQGEPSERVFVTKVGQHEDKQ